jgi:hypothetical protein
LKKGWSAVEKAKMVQPRTAREQAYIAAIETFYKDYDKVDHRTRTFAYSDAMKRVHQLNPSDREAAVFYALTLIATGTMSPDKSYTRQKEAARILNRILALEPITSSIVMITLTWPNWLYPPRAAMRGSLPRRPTRSTCLHTFSSAWVCGRKLSARTSMLMQQRKASLSGIT